MRHYGVIGTTFRESTSEFQGRFHIDPTELERRLPALREACGVSEIVYLTTCNRVELIFASDTPHSLDAVRAGLLGFFGLNDTADGFHAASGPDAIRHLLRVAASLDSLVVGETQILGQVKAAYFRAQEMGLAGTHLTPLFEHVFHVAKQIRSKTGLGQGAVSVASVAARLIEEGEVSSDVRIALVGSGPMTRKAAQHLWKRGYHDLTFANRTPEKIQDLAEQHGGRVLPLTDFLASPPEVDVVITATSAPGPLFTPEVIQAMRARRSGREPMLFVDLAVPRDTDPGIADHDVRVVCIDDLQGAASRHLEGRSVKAAEAESLIGRAILSFERKLVSRRVGQVARRLEECCVRTSRSVVEELLSGRLRHLDAEDKAAIQELAERLGTRLAHQSIREFKETSLVAAGASGHPSGGGHPAGAGHPVVAGHPTGSGTRM